MSTKHSPGPWRVERIRCPWNPDDREQDSLNIFSQGDRDYVASMPGRADNDEVVDNARLIAAAPEMLALLREFVNGPGTYTWRDTKALLARIDGKPAT